MSTAWTISRWFSCRMFIGTEISLPIGFSHAQAKMANLIRCGLLRRASGGAYDQWSTALAQNGPWGTAPWATALGMSRLARVQVRDTADHEDRAIWPLRWEVTGPQGALVPVLDADIRLTPAGADATMLAVSAVCRPPLGGLAASLDQLVIRQVAQATIRAFADHIGSAVMHPAASPGAGHDGIPPEAGTEPGTPLPYLARADKLPRMTRPQHGRGRNMDEAATWTRPQHGRGLAWPLPGGLPRCSHVPAVAGAPAQGRALVGPNGPGPAGLLRQPRRSSGPPAQDLRRYCGMADLPKVDD